MPDEVRVQYEGFRPGMYVRMRFPKMCAEFVTHFDPCYPVVVGGLLSTELSKCYTAMNMKVHRWYPKILKDSNPLILSMGWRRFETVMKYGKRGDDLKCRAMKYARKHLTVEGIFWGPSSEKREPVVAFQSVSDRTKTFRICASGVVCGSDMSTNISKKCTFIGYPHKIKQKTAFIKDMFKCDEEVAGFLNAKIKTQSGIRGIVKKPTGNTLPPGTFRATFEDRILMSGG